MPESEVLSDIDHRGIATVTLNRPAVNNAYNGEMINGLIRVVSELQIEDQVRIVVLRGNGRHFQAGADLAWINSVAGQDDQAGLEVSRQTARAVRGLNEMSKPTIALIHGACVGGGTGIAAACDIVIAAENAFFAISEARWGLAAQIIFPQLNAAMGARNVRRFALSCERFDAYKAREVGLVHEVCSADALDETAAPIIDGLLMAAPDALTASKRSIQQCAGHLVSDEHLEALIAEHAAKRRTAEAAEGLASFAEKRNPAWYP
jgi:methylglutaconyl-CoA hydratase